MEKLKGDERAMDAATFEATEARALLTAGISTTGVYEMVQRAIEEVGVRSGVLVDVGCGTGDLWPFVSAHFDRYIGVDAVRYPGLPADAEFALVNLDTGAVPLEDGTADVTVSAETIEHLENPRALVRELVRITRPAGWVVVTTPNQLSLLSLATLAVKGQFSAFQDVEYPKHITALVEVDLRRIAQECGLRDVRIRYSTRGRVVFTPAHFPRWLSRHFPRALSDNVLMMGRVSEG